MNRLARSLPTIARLGLGLVFFVFGLNGFLHFLPTPPPSARALPFVGGLLGAGYFFPLLKSLEVAAGFALLANRFVPLALAVLAPIIVNIAAFHLFLSPGNYPVVAFILAAELYLAWSNRGAYAPMLAARPLPDARQRPTLRAAA
jgi:putative oxidoreductase